MLPIQSAADFGGQHHRCGIILRALGRLYSDIQMVYIVPEQMLPLGADPSRLDAAQSAFWVVPVRVALAKRRSRVPTFWNYYGAGIASAIEQKALYPYGGAALAGEIGRYLDSKPDLVFADRLDAMVPVMASGRKPKRLVMDIGDIYHRVLLRSALQPPFRAESRLLALQAPSLILAERRAANRADLAFVCSPTDEEHLRKLRFSPNIQTVPNAVDIPPAAPAVVAAPTLLYLGSYYHPPNILAAERLMRRIWPLVQAQVPGARLLIAGAESERLPSRTASIPGVEFLGFVEDIPGLYAATRVVCAPITTGSGTRLKLLEAAAYARPMVSTRIGAEGLDFRDGQEIILREDNRALAAACVSLLHDDALCRRLGAAARAMVQDRYEARRIEQRVVDLIGQAG